MHDHEPLIFAPRAVPPPLQPYQKAIALRQYRDHVLLRECARRGLYSRNFPEYAPAGIRAWWKTLDAILHKARIPA